MKTISLRLPDALHARLEEAADRQGRSKSALVREALERYISRGKGPARASVLARAKDLAGCVEGPADLSTNREYLTGYGH